MNAEISRSTEYPVDSPITEAEITGFTQELDQLDMLDGVVLMGGGSGVSAIAREFVQTVKGRVSIIVGTGDSGSKTGDLRDIYLTPAVGDLRKVTAALARNPLAGELFDSRSDEHGVFETASKVYRTLPESINDLLVLTDYTSDPRFAEVITGAAAIARRAAAADYGNLQGHTFGNLALTYAIARKEDGGLGMQLGEAVELVSRGLGIDERISVLPSSETPHHMRLKDGNTTYVTEGVADEAIIEDPHGAKVTLHHIIDGEVSLYAPARLAVEQARTIILSQGSVYTSHGANLAVPGMRKALAKNANRPEGADQQRLVVAANLTVERDTQGFTLEDYLRKLGRMAGRMADFVVVNGQTDQLPEGKVPFKYDEQRVQGLGLTVLTAALLAAEAEAHSVNDPLLAKGLRNLVKTSGHGLAQELADADLV